MITEIPWEGVSLQRDCLCSNRSDPITIHTLTAPVVEINFTVTMMNITEDYDDFAFEGEYKFIASGPGDETVCSSGWGERKLRGSSGEVKLHDTRHATVIPEIMGDRHVVSESVKAEVACVHRPWLIEAGGDNVIPIQGRYLYLRFHGFEINANSQFCPTTNRLILYEARDTLRPQEICPESTSTLEYYSPGWTSNDTSSESSLKPHARSFVIEFLQNEPGDYSIKWIEVMKKPSYDNDPEATPLPFAYPTGCAYR